MGARRPCHVGVLVETSRAYGRGVATGVVRYARERDWILYPQESGLLRGLPPWLGRDPLDGLIVDVYTRKMAAALRMLRRPIVDTYCEGHLKEAPLVETDPEATGRMAAEFFLQAGFTRFAFCGYPGIYFSDSRERAFAGRIRAAGFACVRYAPPSRVRHCQDLFLRERGGMEYERDLARWLGKLPKPIAVMACNDIRGQQVLTACRDYRIKAPDEVAVLGVDNDLLICEMSHPTLSSIVPDSEGIGRQAAELLERLMAERRGSRPAPAPLRHARPPLQIVERQSTSSVPDSHPVVARAVQLIRDEACHGLTVELLCERLGFGRTHVDGLFRLRLGRTVSREIQRVRLARARRLLLDTELPLAQVARQSGFLGLPHFCRLFKRHTGCTPQQFRRGEKISP